MAKVFGLILKGALVLILKHLSWIVSEPSENFAGGKSVLTKYLPDSISSRMGPHQFILSDILEIKMNR
jgi:hypothetical protein